MHQSLSLKARKRCRIGLRFLRAFFDGKNSIVRKETPLRSLLQN